MIVLGRNPEGITLGDLGVLPAQIPTGGDFPSPLTNDLDAGDDTTQLLWVILPDLPATGTLQVSDAGEFRHLGPSDLATINYRLFSLPAEGAPVVTDGIIESGVVPPLRHELFAYDRVVEVVNESGTLVATPDIPPALLPSVGRPVADFSAGAWAPSSGATLHAMLSEVSPDDLTFISATEPSTCHVLLERTEFPGTATQVLSYRASSATESTLTVDLLQGAVLVASWSHELTVYDTTYTRQLSAIQIAAISAGALSVRLSVA